MIFLMYKNVLIILCVCFFWPAVVLAGAPPCGMLDREDVVDDVYLEARAIGHVKNIRAFVDILCSSVGEWDEWKKSPERRKSLRKNKEYKARESDLIQRILKDLNSTRHYIILYKAWKRKDVSGAIDEARRHAYLKKSYKNIDGFSDRVSEHQRGIENIMSSFSDD